MVKAEDLAHDGSADDEALYRKVGSSSSKPSYGSALVKEENLQASTSGDLKSYFVEMGFSSIHVDKVIEENGNGDVNTLLESLIKNSRASPEDSDSWEGFSSSEKEEENPSIDVTSDYKQEVKRASPEDSDSWEGFSNYLKEEENPSIDVTSDYKQEVKGLNGPSNAELDKKSYLLMMDFSEAEIDLAINRLGVNAALPELVEFIVAAQTPGSFEEKLSGSADHGSRENEDLWDDYEDVKPLKKAKHLPMKDNIASGSNQTPASATKPNRCHEPQNSAKGILVKEEIHVQRTPTTLSNNSQPCRLPYFFYGNVVEISQASWKKLSRFLYATEPEFVNSQFFSALIRKEGYLHNLPTDRRFHILPKPPTKIEDALPHTKKWWPSWDTRKQLNSISSESTGVVQLCERLGRIMMESRGFLSKEQQIDIIHQCQPLNLIWVGQHKLRPMEIDEAEVILGYPRQHTDIWGLQAADRLARLRYCFQTDTLGYHLSVLKSMYPDGLRLLSIFSGIGGAEVALHRLGIRLKYVVSVEVSEINREILKRWWENTGQTGVLKQIGGIEKLTSQMLANYMNQFGGFDVIIGSNPGEFTRGSSRQSSADVDFNLFFEFVRVFQRVRSLMGRNS